MPEEIQNGKATLFGIANDGTTIAMEGYATFTLEAAKGQHKFKLDTLEDEQGFDHALIATNGHIEVDISWNPTGATKAAAAATAAFLVPLRSVTLAHFLVAAFNGDWIYVGDQSIELNHKIGKMSLKLRKYDDAEQNASLTTTVS